MRDIGLVAVAVLVVVLVASCSCKAQLGHPSETGGTGASAPSGAAEPATSAPASAAETGPKVVVLDVGDQRDEAGNKVTHQTREFSPDTKAIYVDAGVKGLSKGDKVTGTLQAVHVKTKAGQEIRDVEVVSTQLEAPGEESTFNFKFSAPKNGWPVGDYEVRLSTGGKTFEAVELTVK